MLSKNEIKDIQSLGLKKHRLATGLFVAEGPKIVLELATLIPSYIEKIIALPAWIDQHRDKLGGLNIVSVDEKALERVSGLQTPNTALAVIRQFGLALPAAGKFIYLDRIKDPGNLGTIIRIADWFGLSGVICSEGCAEVFNPKVVQSTMASLARVPVHYDDGSWIESFSGSILAAALDGKSVYELSPFNSGLLMIGNESQGLSDPLMQRATQKVTIPARGGAESLNAAVATGIIVSHVFS